MSGCLRYARRDSEIDTTLAVWRELWNEASALERAYQERPGEGPAAPATAAATGGGAGGRVPGAGLAPLPSLDVNRGFTARSVAAAIAVVTLLTVGLLGGSAAQPGPPMTGLYNIVLTPIERVGPAGRVQLAESLQHTLTRELRAWSDAVPAIQLRGPERVDSVRSDAEPDRSRELADVALAHGADIVLAERVRAVGDDVTVAVDIFLTERIFEETPEFVGRHEITLTEPADVLDRIPAINEGLATGTLHYLKAVLAVVRGLGDYAMDDYAGAEADLLTAAGEFQEAERAADGLTTRTDVVHLMLGNAVGRGARTRLDAAAGHYQRALAENPTYARAHLGLAEATRVAAGCEPGGGQVAALDQAVAHYRAALAANRDDDATVGTSLAMKVRLGLGLTYQCLAVSGLGGSGLGGSVLDSPWAAAEAEFAEVLRLHGTSRARLGTARYRLRLAAEARAGQALTALVTADRPEGARYGGYSAAARGYEEALALLTRIDTTRRTNLERELTFLRNLRSAYLNSGETAQLADVERRIAAANRRLAGTARSRLQ